MVIVADGVNLSDLGCHPIGANNEISLNDLKKIYVLMKKMRNHLETDEDKIAFWTMAKFFSKIDIIPTKSELHLKSVYERYLKELFEEAGRSR